MQRAHRIHTGPHAKRFAAPGGLSPIRQALRPVVRKPDDSAARAAHLKSP